MLSTPVLFIIFNQPETTQVVFDAIRKVQPEQLFVAADGPRLYKKGEHEKCEATRAIIKQVDWNCEVKTLFHKENLGCDKALFGAFDWFFKNVEEGIVLESDCLPHPDFWNYAAELLERYRYEETIKSIGGNNFQQGIQRGDGSYYYSAFLHIWGWATWRRAWEDYDYNVAKKTTVKEAFAICKWLYKKEEAQKYWMTLFKYIREGRPNMWDYRIAFSNWKKQGLSIVPNVNLVTNIGFHPDAISTKDLNSPFANLPLNPILPLKHPSLIERDITADNYYYDYYLDGTLNNSSIRRKVENIIPWKLRKKISSIFRKQK